MPVRAAGLRSTRKRAGSHSAIAVSSPSPEAAATFSQNSRLSGLSFCGAGGGYRRSSQPWEVCSRQAMTRALRRGLHPVPARLTQPAPPQDEVCKPWRLPAGSAAWPWTPACFQGASSTRSPAGRRGVGVPGESRPAALPAAVQRSAVQHRQAGSNGRQVRLLMRMARPA